MTNPADLSSTSFPENPPHSGTRLGRYEILRLLGQGGMGMVFEAVDHDLGRPVALKILWPRNALRMKDVHLCTELRERFHREARAAACLAHDNVVAIYDLGTIDGYCYLTMPLVQGETLEERLRREPRQSLRQIIRICCEIAEGLHAAHMHGLVHRDIKPSNVFLETGSDRAKLLDFGIAKWLDEPSLTQTGELVGTPLWLSPEQAKGIVVGPQSDLFNLGSILYFMSVGVHPFAINVDPLRAICEHNPDPPHRHPNGRYVPLALSDLITRLLAKEPHQRPANALEVVRELKSIPLSSAGLFITSYPQINHAEFVKEVRRLIPISRRITLVATGINLLAEHQILDLLFERARDKGVSIRICMGNPWNPHVQSRLIEEDMERQPHTIGKSGLENIINLVVERLSKLGNQTQLEYRLFEHHPTFATLIFDNNLFIYFYGYKRLGNHSPLLHLCDDGSDEAKFFTDNVERIWKAAVPATVVVRQRDHPEFVAKDWLRYAVYIIPEADDEFYQFGSNILGYDIQREQPVPESDCPIAGVRAYVGDAARYGFHATLADALFFTGQSAVDRVRAELRFLADSFAPFRLDRFHIPSTFARDSRTIVLLCDDPLGQSSVLHHEMAARIYPLSISSNYLARDTRVRSSVTTSARYQYLQQRYKAPFVLNEFTLHFTLCTVAPESEEERQAVRTSIQQSLEAVFQRRKRSELMVRELCLVQQVSGSPHFSIVERFHLRGRQF